MGAAEQVDAIAAWAARFGLVGGRLHHVLTDPELYFGAGRHQIITDLARRQAVEGLVVFDTTGITGHADHRWATRAAVAAGGLLELPVLAWTLPDQVASTLDTELGTSFRGRPTAQIDLVVDVDRSRQLKAGESHRSQAVPGAPLWRRLELLEGREHLRWLHPGNRTFPVELQLTADCPNWQDTYTHWSRP